MLYFTTRNIEQQWTRISPKSVWLSPSSQPSKQPTWVYHHRHYYHSAFILLFTAITSAEQCSRRHWGFSYLINFLVSNLIESVFTWEMSSCGNVGKTSGSFKMYFKQRKLKPRTKSQAAKLKSLRLLKTYMTKFTEWMSAKCKSLQSLQPQDFGFTHPGGQPACLELKYQHCDQSRIWVWVVEML